MKNLAYTMKSILVIVLLFLKAFSFDAHASTNLTAVSDPQRMTVKLKWQNLDAGINSFVLQRSADNNKWVDLYTIESNGFSANKIEKYTDQHPGRAKNFYRLKIINGNSNIEYSSPIIIILGQPNSSWAIFPVPVTTVLNLQYTGSEPIEGVISVFVQNSRGQVFHRVRCSSLSRSIQIPVSNLGKGIYDVRIMIGNENVWNQRFIK